MKVQGIGDVHDSHANTTGAPIGVPEVAYTNDEMWLNPDEQYTPAPGHQLHCHQVKRQNTRGLVQLIQQQLTIGGNMLES